MYKNLIITVGDSKAPILTSVKRIKPVHIVFICSDDKDGTKGSYTQIWDEKDDRRMQGQEVKEAAPPKACDACGNVPRWNNEPSISTQLGLSQDQFDIVKIQNPDNIQDCYNAAKEGIHLLINKAPSFQVVADYTGATKTMSYGLISASMDHGQIEIMVVTGKRRDLVKVADGTQRVTNSNWKGQMIEKQINQMKDCIADYQYEACIEIGNQLSSHINAGSEECEKVQFYATIAEGLKYWDLFNYQKAKELLSDYGPDMGRYLGYLGNVINNLEDMNNGKDNKVKPKKISMALLFDVMRNAERKIMQGKYDDAVARVYRALELMAQIGLRYQNPSIDTAEVPVEHMPESFIKQRGYTDEKQTFSLGLIASYELLRAQNHPIGRVFAKKEEKLKDLLNTRNNSFMAHGYAPFTEKRTKMFYDFMLGFVKEVLEELKEQGYKLDLDSFEKALQFPDSFEN
ncbi:TIGR02710 family CRISPR-associated CARF protein [Tindallia californiensis]|uniref:CRISPR-associated protein, TIGR02710 family n=1 Tax=Tindallia californiensis TaxID=159292 RepID=A0A1H3PPI9_9FIRM|nr:TIGR02710 family CRISPR-associated CARF protein [Tindallia californiensis]SDZ03152.1 CRISPR-associated protein, TIGR02710 family [Tindallia californiensis]